MGRMKEFEVRKIVAADAATIYELLDDSASWPSWTPLDAYEPVTPPGPDGLGEVRLFRNGRYTMHEKIVERRPAQRLSYTLLSGLAVRDYRADIDLRQLSDTSTEVHWHTTFRPKVVGTGWLYVRALTAATENFVDGLVDHFATTPQRTGPTE